MKTELTLSSDIVFLKWHSWLLFRIQVAELLTLIVFSLIKIPWTELKVQFSAVTSDLESLISCRLAWQNPGFRRRLLKWGFFLAIRHFSDTSEVGSDFWWDPWFQSEMIHWNFKTEVCFRHQSCYVLDSPGLTLGKSCGSDTRSVVPLGFL